ncbi:uncharacterized protein L969DRAFT_93723 [Mixia osmundae IAM 14324]|uniref:Uncharacterized protein n=1 Tax=Mixia osmundae (strain CBS 9802 / IAM 14324 / JCM 22182 / KY 12970) TaxID=764103 RepID=G7E9E2_MIXOS|nr:uncharacterized protein L969DRAFT_93723 [Mixia osmundae IAM 14324]KEI39891.1 hypothetical protein L969DRAFT_93723 [Mixia osmundae IAM 14324]GAA99261.1 hypothetical protein E5Q_05955 [Mixia osmundae IAM 14324]
MERGPFRRVAKLYKNPLYVTDAQDLATRRKADKAERQRQAARAARFGESNGDAFKEDDDAEDDVGVDNAPNEAAEEATAVPFAYAPTESLQAPTTDRLSTSDDLRTSALSLRSDSFKTASTGLIFDWLNELLPALPSGKHRGGKAIGLEWIADDAINVVFADSTEAANALVRLTAGQSPGANQEDELHEILKSLESVSDMYETTPEEELALLTSSRLARPLRAMSTGSTTVTSDEAKLARDKRLDSADQDAIAVDAPTGTDDDTASPLNRAVFARFATLHDVKANVNRKSEWHRREGNRAGKDGFATAHVVGDEIIEQDDAPPPARGTILVAQETSDGRRPIARLPRHFVASVEQASRMDAVMASSEFGKRISTALESRVYYEPMGRTSSQRVTKHSLDDELDAWKASQGAPVGETKQSKRKRSDSPEDDKPEDIEMRPMRPLARRVKVSLDGGALANRVGPMAALLKANAARLPKAPKMEDVESEAK